MRPSRKTVVIEEIVEEPEIPANIKSKFKTLQ